jgi:uncharacterized protein (DUF1330 family)
MPAYILLVRDRIIDADAMATYSAKAAPSTHGHVLRPLVYYGRVEALEGTQPDGVVIIEFPDAQAARNWYRSPAYQEALPYRLKGADCRVFLADGV